MKKKKVIVLLLILAVISASLYMISQGRNDAKMVLKIPFGFVHLQDNLGNGLTVMPFETQISFLDSDGVGIYSTGFKNSDFIVKYKGEYYVNEEKLLELLDIAAISADQRRKVYKVGDEIKIYGVNKNHVISILGVNEEIIDAKNFFDIKFSAPNITENDLKSIFSFVEIEVMDSSNSGTDNLFEFIDAETVRLEMKVDRTITAIILKNPEYPGLTYRVVMGE